MNIHPLFVHFPIALFTIYAILELLSGSRFLRNQTWKASVKGFLVIAGTVLSFMTLSTGEAIEDIVVRANPTVRDIVETHAFFANASTYIFLGLALIYLFRIVKTRLWYVKVPLIIRRIIDLYSRLLDRRWIMVLGALVGLIAITITGALGGAIVYGPDTDPIVKFIFNLFF